MGLRRVVRQVERVWRRHGALAAGHFIWFSLTPQRSTLTLFGLTNPLPPPAFQGQGGPESHLADLEEVERLVREGLQIPDSPRRLAEGDCCLVQTIGSRLAGYTWLSSGPEVELEPGVWLAVPDDTAYLYRTWTDPDTRGRSLQARRTVALFDEAQRRGRRRLLCFVEATNYASLRGVRKAGYVPIGAIRILRTGPPPLWHLTITDPTWTGVCRAER